MNTQLVPQGDIAVETDTRLVCVDQPFRRPSGSALQNHHDDAFDMNAPCVPIDSAAATSAHVWSSARRLQQTRAEALALPVRG
ncbi:hypothetical protein [Caballeronia sp. LZ001]|uniref:hypothetical protein n=1 Tax=Caballeronia sp. LZ001 TaxID=3038553 RepID=UPI00285CBF2D|nr:hypothetical protein [Caballeronia sp. LZ001]MDR5804028.1 hypothetical protein [Caballeronia sp. LZ001]